MEFVFSYNAMNICHSPVTIIKHYYYFSFSSIIDSSNH